MDYQSDSNTQRNQIPVHPSPYKFRAVNGSIQSGNYNDQGIGGPRQYNVAQHKQRA